METSMDTGSGADMQVPHVTVCICTYKRPVLLRKLLEELGRQQTGGLFTYSIVVADNDRDRTGEPVVEEARSLTGLEIKYCVEPSQSIALARNAAVANATGDFLAFIDDDEYPIQDWLLRLFNTREKYGVAGVLGPVRRYFDQTPPVWLEKSNFYIRPVYPTGAKVDWLDSRTSNVLLKRELLVGDASPFRPQFRSGEDQDFFQRKIEDGHTFIWSGDADVFEVVPPARWSRRYLMKKGLLRGANQGLRASAASIVISLVAVPVYVLTLPLTVFGGQRLVMTQLVKLCDHLGQLLIIVGINPIREQYVSEQEPLVVADGSAPTATKSEQKQTGRPS